MHPGNYQTKTLPNHRYLKLGFKFGVIEIFVDHTPSMFNFVILKSHNPHVNMSAEMKVQRPNFT